MQFSPQATSEFKTILKKYPDKRSCLLPLLHLAQREFGWISGEAMDFIAGQLQVPVMQVYETATFYTMYNKKPVGKYHLQVCTNISCSLLNAEHIVKYLEEKLGIGVGETSEDGKFTLTEVECLGSCGTAPVMMINDDYYENLTPERIDAIISKLN